jgi:signal transduction histidine kinase
MPNATWGDPEPRADEAYSPALLRQLLQQMMRQFAASGACIALFDESIGQMVVRMHVRARGTDSAPAHAGTEPERINSASRRTTIQLNPASTITGGLRHPSQPLEKLDIELFHDGDLFPVGALYPIDHDMIGYAWRTGEAYIMRHEDYTAMFHPGQTLPSQVEITPTWYLVAPILEPTIQNDGQNRRWLTDTLGVVVIYQITPGPGFQQKQCNEAVGFSERIALYLQNDRLRRSQDRTLDYIRRLQQVSTAFPTSVKLANLVEDVYYFTTSVVDVSSMQLTLYDRDMDRIYDVFAIADGKRVEGLPAHSVVKEDRPLWWHIAQVEQRRLMLDLSDQEPGKYEELLTGVWGDQRKAKSFLFLPMKMFTRVIGSLSLTSMHADAYRPEEILVLETMVQIITVSIENAKLYDKVRRSLREAKQREETLAAMNSALQTVSSVLNVGELLHNLAEFAAKLVHAELSTFFQISADGKELIAEAVYAPTSRPKDWTELSTDAVRHKDLIEMIRLPFTGSILAGLVGEPFFYLDYSAIQDLAQASAEGGGIFLRETGTKQILMIPVRYQTELTGILAIHTLGQSRLFHPKEVGVLMAVCAQAGSAIRNAQLFEEIQEANAQLQHMDKLKDEFIVTASHELRTPLSAIQGYSTLLQRQHARTTPQQILRFATKISEATQQLSALVVNMTEASQLGTLDKNLQTGPVKLATAAEVARDILSANIEQQITLRISHDLWALCDPLRLRQVISNLFDNAAKYSPPGSHIELEASATRLAHLELPEDQLDPEQGDIDVVLVRVRDEGDGIDEEDQQKIFEKFVRASRSLTTPVRGTGLGLYICRRYIEAMGGKLWLEQSTPGAGSVFSFYLPRIDAPAETGESHEST